MNNREGLYSSAISRFRSDIPLHSADEHLSERAKNFHFSMRTNGYFFLKGGAWAFNPDTTRPFVEEFKGQNVAFFGPSSSDKFFSDTNIGSTPLIYALGRQSVTDVIGKYRDIDEDQAARIAFLFGGIVRHTASQTASDSLEDVRRIANGVEFAARMTKFGERKSGDAIASAMARYVMSGGVLERNKHFEGDVYRMGEAVREDPVIPTQTEDLGLSQVARLSTFLGNSPLEVRKQSSEADGYKDALKGLPTVGAEFHFPLDISEGNPYFWQRLALLNMSQYQRGSYVQLSRNDRDVIEVRMNPSIYPVTIANWNHMRLLLPELNQAFFTITLNRKNEAGNFAWTNSEDKTLLDSLRSLGMLTYAGMFENVPQSGRDEINFGSVYLGQTVKMNNGEYNFSGGWYGGEGQNGQFGVYVGFGNNLPHLAYYLSMALADPSMLDDLPRKRSERPIKTLGDALAVNPSEREGAFKSMQNHIQANGELRKASEAGNQIMRLLNP